LGLSFLPWGLPSGGQGTIPVSPLTEEELGEVTVSQPQRAGESDVVATSKPPAAPTDSATAAAALPTNTPVPTPKPLVKVAPPLDAAPMTKFQPVSGGSQTWIAQVAARTTEQLEVAVVSLAAEMDPLARATTSLLASKQINAYEAKLDDVRRPDVLLLLDASASGASVWYCSPSQTASETLAATLLGGIAALPAETNTPADEHSRAMPCDSLHLGRASSAAALVRLPADAIGPGVDTSSILARAVTQYLDENAEAIRLSREALHMTWPAIGPITSHYGPDHPLGIDIGQATGAIVAATDGTVIFAGGDPCCSYGRFVVISGPDNVTTLYGHLSSMSVREGDHVRLGQPIGVVGCTGHCTGPHLHFEVIKAGVRQNPMDYLP
jgi:murein DD-endopeptidase MepM/ murein hydrolase activator NlpD